ncbi:MAG: hypothetical protein GY869_19160, partial [Planctomycetes bacterium]|nr:hypothetical protein [Planctomycetota bacterium]
SAAIDFVIQNEYVSQTTITRGTNVNMGCQMRNIGSTNYVINGYSPPFGSPPSDVGWVLSTNTTPDTGDLVLGGDYVTTNINSGSYFSSSASSHIPSGTTPGTWYVIFIADPYDDVYYEGNENNNYSSIKVTIVDIDSDGDGTPDNQDGCPSDPEKTEPGTCGCGTPETDSNGDGTPK